MPVSISAGVGRHSGTGLNAPNRPDDVRAVQRLLRIAHYVGGSPTVYVALDGLVGRETIDAIGEFQRAKLGFADGVVDPGNRTLAELNAAASAPKIAVLQAGDTAKTDPYTIAILANPVLEAPWNAGVFQSDPIMDDPLAFDSAASLYFNALFGRLSGQAEQLLADPAIGPRIRVVRVFRFLIETVDANCLIGQDGVSTMLIARRDRFAPFLASAGLAADVAFATSASATHTRASAWYTSDNDAGPGTAYTLDGVARVHRHYCLIPGTAALHTTSGSVVALHEFGHAASSYTNGAIGDQYVDSQASLNVKRGRPIPATYGEYDGTSHSSDAARDGLGYPAGWQSYHCELTDATVPSLMDDFWQIPAGRLPQHCPFDRVTRRFLHDRLLAKLNR